MKEYDFAFSLGFCCTCSQAMRAEGLQYSSTPFDWVGVTDILQAPRIIASDFEGWIDREDLELWDVRITGGFVTRVYRNRKTGVGFVHEFSNDGDLDAVYSEVKAKFDRRIVRFISSMTKARRALAVYLEVSKNARADNAKLIEAQKTLKDRYPQAEIDLLYLYEDPAAAHWEVETAPIAEGITAVKLDYRTFLNGEIMHLCRDDQIRDFIRTFASVPDTRTEEEKKKFAEFKRCEVGNALGKTWLERKINKKLRQLFRDIESYLEGQLILPGDRPLWFDGDGK